ncbi:related to AIM1 |uniref:Related to AIM1 \|nr:related to AIM1 \
MACRMASRAFLQISRAPSRFINPTRTRTAFATQTSFQHIANQRHYSTPASSPVEAPEYLDANEAKIFATIKEALQPTKLEVQDVSGGCGSMYALDIVSEQFAGLSVIKQHRMVNKILGDEIKKWHGVQLKTKAP